MEIENIQSEPEIFDLQFDLTAKTHLATIVSWAKVIAIASLISNVVSLLVSLFGKDKLPAATFPGIDMSAFNSGQSVFTIISSGIGVLLAILMLQFSQKVNYSLQTGSNESMSSGWRSLKIYFQLSAIMSMVFISIILLAAVVILSTGAMNDIIK